MKTRILTGILLGLVFVPVFVIGDWLLYVVLGLMSVYAGYELLRMIGHRIAIPKSVLIYGLLVNGLFYSLLVYGFLVGDLGDFLLMVLLGLILSGSILMVAVDEMKFDLFAKVTMSVLYPVLGFASLAFVRDVGLVYLGLLFVITISTDVFAYFVGVSIGRHKLAPKISPKKSIEGSLGGLFFAAIFSVVYVLLLGLGETSVSLELWMVAVVAVLVSVMAQVGDLVASKMKRTYDVKDFSNIFPGHGGVMDRFDSSVFAAMLFVVIVLLGLV